MTVLTFASNNKQVSNFEEIKAILSDQGILYERWSTEANLSIHDSQETVLKAYEHELKPFMDKNGFKSADVINVHPETPNIQEIRAKFLKEHTHSEDEVRFFVDGEGLFWFHFEDGEVVSLRLVKGDFISVPKGYKHWFDLAPNYFVKAIRVFSNMEGWVANYTGSGIDEKYNKL